MLNINALHLEAPIKHIGSVGQIIHHIHTHINKARSMHFLQ